MDDFVNALTLIEKDIAGAGIALCYKSGSDSLDIRGPGKDVHSLRLVRLYRPSSSDVLRNTAPDALLVITAGTEKAARAAAPYNHLLIPDGGFRLIVPGIALLRDRAAAETDAKGRDPHRRRQVRLMGRTGVVAESLLLGGDRHWSVRDLAAASEVSPALAQRVIHRLEQETLLVASGAGREKTRIVGNPRALAELWSEEEKAPQSILRGFLYGTSTEALAERVLTVCPPGSAVGGTLAANLYKPVLTKVPVPLRLWVPDSFNGSDTNALKALGFQETDEGANIEFVRLRHDPWKVHRNSEAIPRVSRWRAWLEVSSARGRIQELADALLADLEGKGRGQ